MASLRNTETTPTGRGCLLTFFPAFIAFGLAALVLLFNAISTGSFSAPADGRLASFFAAPVQRWGGAVEEWAADYDLDPNLVATVMQIESCGDPRAQSSAGAAGLFQVMPFHFEPGENPTDPHTNARRGLDYLKQSLETSGGDVRLALAGYNGGIGVIGQPEWSWAAETRRYADWGYRIYMEAASGKDTSATLQHWLDSGGANLCRQASARLLLGTP